MPRTTATASPSSTGADIALDPARPGLTVPIVGATVAPDFPASAPAGFRVAERVAVIGRGSEDFARAAAATFAWEVKRRAGFRPPASPAALGEDLEIRLGVGPLTLREPARVVAVVDEPRRRGFAYATRPGHPLRGEEAFVVAIDGDDVVTLTLRSLSAPAAGWRALAWPIIRLAQVGFRRRYARVLRAR